MSERIVESYPIITSFIKGINQELDEQLIAVDEAVIAENCYIDDGNFSLGKGYIRINEYNFPSGEKTLMRHFHGGEATILVAIDDKLYIQEEDGTFRLLASGFSNNQFDYINYQVELDEITIFTNGVDNVKLFDGNTIRDLKHDGRESDEKSNNKAPKGKFIELHKERVWIAGDSENPNRLYFSKDFDPDDWTYPIDPVEANQHGGFIDIPTWDGGIIIGIKSLYDDLVVFKNKNVFRIFGTYPGNYNVVQVFDTVEGNILDNTIASLDNISFWTSTHGIHYFNGTNTTQISKRIRKIFERLNKEYAQKAVATIYNRKYILSMPVDDATENNIVIEFDIDKGNFTVKTDMNITSFLEIKDRLLFINNNNHVYEYGIGNTYDGQVINSVWETGIIHFGEQNARKILNRIYFNAKGNGKIRVTAITERKIVSKEIELTPDMQFYRFRLRNKGRYFKFRFENIDGCDFTIKQPQFMFDFDYD